MIMDYLEGGRAVRIWILGLGFESICEIKSKSKSEQFFKIQNTIQSKAEKKSKSESKSIRKEIHIHIQIHLKLPIQIHEKM